MTESTFKPGDVVMLRSGGPASTVSAVNRDTLNMIYYNSTTGLYATYETHHACMRHATTGPQAPDGVSALRSTSVSKNSF